MTEQAKPHIIPVILSGGSGSRLWPVSTVQRPKQFQKLMSDQPMIAETAHRVSDAHVFDAPIVIGNADHKELLVECLADYQPQLTLLEPMGRNTAAAIALAALAVEKINPEAIMVVLPSDHVIRDVMGFVDTTCEAAVIAGKGYLVTFGIVPTEPHTGYGYIERGDKISGINTAYKIERFIEKPDRSTAIRMLASGGYSWNSGMFVFKAKVVLDEFKVLAPDILEATRAAFEQANEVADKMMVLPETEFGMIPSIAFDRAIMEKTRNAMVLPAIFDWSDVGSWLALHNMAEQAGKADVAGNVVIGTAKVDTDVNNSYVRNDTDMPLFVTGVDKVVVVVSAGGIVVTSKQNEQNVKRALDMFPPTAAKKG